MEFRKLSNGVEIPAIQFGTWRLDVKDAKQIVINAIEAGYTGIDCAYSYGNDFFVGKAIKDCGVARDKLFLTNKVWNTFRGEEQVIEACKKSLKLMKLSYFDLYLVHWPVSASEENWKEINRSTWAGMEALYREGLVRSIGVSNFKQHHIDGLLELNAGILPQVNQIEVHPGYNQQETVNFCKSKEIAVQGWSPLGCGELLSHPVLKEIATKYGKTVAQICIRWSYQNSVIPICRSSNPQRMRENLSILDFNIAPDDIERINSIESKTGWSGFDPDIRQPV